MSRLLGSYGSVRPATFSPSDAQIYYLYTPEDGDGTSSRVVRELDPDQVLGPVAAEMEGQENGGDNIWGLYELDLPQNEFSKPGLYDIYIRPREYFVEISDCAFLTNSEVKGIVLDSNSEAISNIESFDGYRVEYYEDGQRVPNFFRIVTSTNRVEPVNTPVGQQFSGSPISYSTNSSGSLLFLTLSPSTNIVDSSGQAPFLGVPGQRVALSNTFFDPIHVALTVSDNTVDSIAKALFGNQLKNVDNGQYAIYDDKGNVLEAFTLAEIRNEFGEKQYEIRRKISPDDLTGLGFNEVSAIIDNNSNQ